MCNTLNFVCYGKRGMEEVLSRDIDGILRDTIYELIIIGKLENRIHTIFRLATKKLRWIF